MVSLIEELDSEVLDLGFFNTLQSPIPSSLFPFYIKGRNNMVYIFHQLNSTFFNFAQVPNLIRRRANSSGTFNYKGVVYHWVNNIIYNKKDKQLVSIIDKVNRKVYVQFGYLFTPSFFTKLGINNQIIYVENLSKILHPILPIKELSKLKVLETDLLEKIKQTKEW